MRSEVIETTANAVAAAGWNCGFERLAWDSEHFGLEIGQLNPLSSPSPLDFDETTANAGAALIDKVCKQSKARVIYATADSDNPLLHRALNKAQFILMDTLVTHKLPKTALCAKLLPSPSVRLAVASDLPELERISVECFGRRGYNVNRLNSDPTLDQAKVLDVYRKSMQNALNGKLADAVFVYVENDQVVGFVTLKLPKGGVAAIPLNAVAVEHHGKGIYTKMMHHVVQHVFENGFEAIEIKTQIPNVSIHRAWARIGASLTDPQYRFHRTCETA